MKSDSPVRVAAINEIGLGDRLAITIRKDNEVLGYIWVLGEKKPLDEHAVYQLMKTAKAARTKMLQFRMKYLREEQGHQDFFWRLLTKSIDERQREAMEHVRAVRKAATIQFHPDIEVGREKMAMAFQELRKTPHRA